MDERKPLQRDQPHGGESWESPQIQRRGLQPPIRLMTSPAPSMKAIRRDEALAIAARGPLHLGGMAPDVVLRTGGLDESGGASAPPPARMNSPS